MSASSPDLGSRSATYMTRIPLVPTGVLADGPASLQKLNLKASKWSDGRPLMFRRRRTTVNLRLTPHLRMTFFRQLPSSGHGGCDFNAPCPFLRMSSNWLTKCLYRCEKQDRVADVLT